jgi:mRNA-degrading endonuclease RelE of RelBE toxin-antitoxin system
MAVKSGFRIVPRVGIAMDALSPHQKAALKPILQSKERFVAYSQRPGMTKKLSTSKPIYAMRAGGGLRVIFTAKDENIVILEIMHKATMDQFMPKGGRKAQASKKAHTKTLA